jgi:hypothetical protein
VSGTGLLGLSLLQVGRGEILSSASEGFWYAKAARDILNRPFLGAVMFLAAVYQLLNGRVLGSASSLLMYALTIQAAQQTAPTNRGIETQSPAGNGRAPDR